MDPEEFLTVSDQFRLGDLITEQPHPETIDLAELAQTDLFEAIDAFHRVDCRAMEQLCKCLEPLPQMVAAMRETLTSGGRIFIAGCGATGRLALSIETFAREAWLDKEDLNRVVSLMAGGDAALIRSIEAFEDYPEYGARQLMELGFCKDDLLIAITEGGETPWVIGACMKAAETSTNAPWFLFCNPPDLLRKLTLRSREVLDSPAVRPFFLDTGPMALAGSTRLQATTVQMLVAGAALREALGHGSSTELIHTFRDHIQRHNPIFMAPFIEAEANIYAAGDWILYQTDAYGMTVLTDTTERAPTFSLAPFENKFSDTDPASWCYLSLPECPDSPAAWERLLQRPPRTLEWPEITHVASLKHLLGHDISMTAADWRGSHAPEKRQIPYRVYGPGPTLDFAGITHDIGFSEEPLLIRHLILKCCLNLQSTLVMGRLGLFESNLMTRVKPSNYKLIDRAARHLQHHHHQQTGTLLPYETAVHRVFENLKK